MKGTVEKGVKEEVVMTWVCMSAIANMNHIQLNYREYELDRVEAYRDIYDEQRFHSALITLSPYSATHEAKKNMKLGKMYRYLRMFSSENTQVKHDQLQENQVVFPTVIQQKANESDLLYYDYFVRVFELAMKNEVKYLVLDISKYKIVNVQAFVKEVFQVVKALKNDFDSITFALDETVQNTQVYLTLKSELDPFVFKD
ncbi:MAG: hypothetical protein SOR80_03325 [Enterococcus cecorum]|nr:hypothetical protein [Enterococcus cecorum]